MQDLNQAYQQLESKLSSDRVSLSKLIFQLSKYCKGQSPELDGELERLYTLLKDGADLEESKSFLRELDEKLEQHGKTVEQQLIEAKDALLAGATLLQKSRGIEPQTVKELSLLTRQIMDPATLLAHLSPCITRLSRMYSNALRYLYSQKQLPVTELTAEPESKEELPQRLVAELTKLLTDFEFDPETTDKLENQRKRLKKLSSPQDLATACADLMRIILLAIKKERSGSEEFLSCLNTSLERINQALDSSLSASSRLNQLQEETEQQLRKHLSGLSTTVEEGEKLDELKVQINTQLTAITALLEKRSAQAEVESELQTSLSLMKERLTNLEKEARQYQIQLNEQRQKLYIDALTNIPNRASFDERYEAEYARAQRYQHPLTLAIIDVDHFKLINDNFGHTAGDKTLSAMGRLLRKWLRRSDFVARYGGEEFTILLPDVQAQQARPLLQKLCDNIAAVPFVYRGQNLKVTISIGAAQADFSQTSLELFEAADKALYEAKNQGRNRVVIADSASTE